MKRILISFGIKSASFVGAVLKAILVIYAAVVLAVVTPILILLVCVERITENNTTPDGKDLF